METASVEMPDKPAVPTDVGEPAPMSEDVAMSLGPQTVAAPVANKAEPDPAEPGPARETLKRQPSDSQESTQPVSKALDTKLASSQQADDGQAKTERSNLPADQTADQSQHAGEPVDVANMEIDVGDAVAPPLGPVIKRTAEFDVHNTIPEPPEMPRDVFTSASTSDIDTAASPFAPVKFSPALGEPPFSVSQEVALANGFYEDNLYLAEALREFRSDLARGKYDERSNMVKKPGPPAAASTNTYNATAPPPAAVTDVQRELMGMEWMGHKDVGSGTIGTPVRTGPVQPTLRITHMAQMGRLKVGDIWRYNRVFNSKSTMTRLELKKECRMTGYAADGLIFEAPKDQITRLADAGNDLVTIRGVTTPTMFETQLLDVDKRVRSSERPNGNAFKCFFIVRDGQELGSLWEVRNKALEE